MGYLLPHHTPLSQHYKSNKSRVISRFGTVIVLVSSGIDFGNTPSLYSNRATRYSREIANSALWFIPEGAPSAWTLQETHPNSTSYA